MGFIKVKKAFILLILFIFVILIANTAIKHHIPNVEYFSKIIQDANENIKNSINSLVEPVVEVELDVIAFNRGKIENVAKKMATSTIKPHMEKQVTKPTVFCIIKTHPENIESNKTQTVLNVWGRKCDNYRFISLIPEHLLPETVDSTNITEEEIEISEPFYILQPRFHTNETHDILTDKLYRAFESIHRRFPDYDWYYISDDDAYVNMNNLKSYLKDKNSSEPLSYGFEFKTLVKNGYHSGGPGYAVSGEAFNRLGKQLIQNYTSCKNSGTDDVDINDCLRMLGTKMDKSIDENGRQRWLCLSLMHHWYGEYPDWMYKYSKHELKKGADCCSDSLIGVHYMSPQEIIRLDIAIEVHQNILNLYDKHLKLGRNITFLDIMKTYVRLEDLEEGTNRYQYFKFE